MSDFKLAALAAFAAVAAIAALIAAGPTAAQDPRLAQGAGSGSRTPTEAQIQVFGSLASAPAAGPAIR